MVKLGANLWLLFLLVTTYTLFLSACGKEAGKVGTSGAALTLIFYLVQFLGAMWEAFAFLQPYGIFYYYLPQKLMYGERDFAVNAAVLVFFIVLCLAAAIVRFNKRDVPG